MPLEIRPSRWVKCDEQPVPWTYCRKQVHENAKDRFQGRDLAFLIDQSLLDFTQS